MSAIYKRELKSYMTGMYGIIFMSVLLLFTGFMVFTYNLLSRQADISISLYGSEIILILVVPVLCMRSMAEDKHNKTDMFLLSLPVNTFSIVIAKYLALITVYAIPTAVISIYPLILGMYGDVNYIGSYTSILGFFLLGAALIAICQFLSSLTESQVIAAVLGIVAIMLLFFLDSIATMLPTGHLFSFIAFVVLALILALAAYAAAKNMILSIVIAAVLIVPMSILYIFLPSTFELLFPTVLLILSPFTGFENIIGGLVDLACITTLLSYIVFFVFLTYQSADRKRWS